MIEISKNWNKIGKYLRDLDLLKIYVKLVRLLELHCKSEYHETRLVQGGNGAFQYVVITLYLSHGTHAAIAYNIKTEALKLLTTLGLTMQYFVIEVKILNHENE